MTTTGVERFAELIAARPVPMGEAALVAASVLGHEQPVGDGIDQLDALAAGVRGRDLDAVCAHLFGDLGFQGNNRRYYDAANSMLPVVLAERRGIPVTLGIVVVDVARRLGIEAGLACMPGHVLVVDPARPDRWIDAFAGGAVLDEAGARGRFRALHGPTIPFLPGYLARTPDRLVLARLLGNLVAVFGEMGDAHHLIRVHQLRATIPEFSDDERAALATLLARVGRYGEAADLWELEADRLDGPASEEAERRAQAARAHLS